MCDGVCLILFSSICLCLSDLSVWFGWLVKGCSLVVTQGSQDALTRAFEMLLEGPQDALLVENPTYSGNS